MKRITLLVLGALATGALALLACEDAARDTFDDADAGVDAGPTLDAAVAPPDDAAPPFDAGDRFDVPDAAVSCASEPCILQLSGSGTSYCARTSAGTALCWGGNDQGQLGYDTGSDFPQRSPTPKPVPKLAGVTHVAVGGGNACARVADGGVACWGNADLVNAARTVPDGGTPLDSPVVEPTREDMVSAAGDVAVGASVACTTTNGALRCWGANDSRELGRGPTSDRLAPPGVVGGLGAGVAFARPGTSRVFAVTEKGALLSWGSGAQWGTAAFLLGRDTSEDPDGVPRAVDLGAAVRGVASSSGHACAVVGRTVDCWGKNDLGQLGRGTFGDDVALPGPTRLAFAVSADDADAGALPSNDIAIDVAVGDNHACAAMASGRVFCWGASWAGQLGARTTGDRSGHPLRVVGLSGPAVAVAATSASSCALLRTGAVECWGTNLMGELGRGTADDVPHLAPARVELPK